MVFLVIFFGAMHGLFLLPVLLSLFGPGSCSSYPEDDLKLSSVEKSYPHPYCISHPQLALTGAFGSKTFLGAPYKAYGDEKDLGLGTSGEDSSESSSSKSQRRQAIEDENTRRRYEEGWRRSSHNLTGQSQFQPVLDLYGQDAVWTKPAAKTPIKIGASRYGYDDMLNIAQGQTATTKKKFDPDRERDRRKSEENRPRKARYEDNRTFEDEEVVNDEYQHTNRYYMYDTSHVKRLSNDSQNSGSDSNNSQNRLKYSDEGDNNKHRRFSDERRPRKFSPPEGIYKQNPNRSSSQHNLYYPRQPPQRAASQSSLHQLRHMGDMRFP